MLLALLALAHAEPHRVGPRTGDYVLPVTEVLVPETRVTDVFAGKRRFCGFEAVKKRHHFDDEIAASVEELAPVTRVDP